MYNKGILLLNWMDSKVVGFISSFCKATSSKIVTRFEKGVEVSRNFPPVAQFYRANMGFIDTHDKNLEYYRINKISKKWWHPIFFHLLDCAVTNSRIVYCEKVGKVGQKKFRESLIEELMGQYIEGKEKKILERANRE